MINERDGEQPRTATAEVKKWNLVIDVANCTNCNLCTLAVQDEYVGNEFPGYAAEMPRHGHRWINIYTRERGRAPVVDVAYLPVLCQHCDDAPCIEAARNGAVKKRDDGIVIIDPDKAKGQRQLVEACPYGAVFWNEEKQLPQHWIFDAHLLDDGWKEPRCAQVCVTRAMQAMKVSDTEMTAIIAEQGLEQLHPEFNTRPRVHYKNLYRYTKCFIGGSVVTEVDGVQDCAQGARVSLVKEGEKVQETETDNYGDFKFDRLDRDSGSYDVVIEADGFRRKIVTVNVTTGACPGRIVLESL